MTMNALDSLKECFCKHVQQSRPEELIAEVIKKGASGRFIVRLSDLTERSLIGIQYTDNRSDNALHYPCAEFLSHHQISTPRIEFADLENGLLLVEDIGRADLHGLKDLPFEQRLPLYKKVFEELYRFSQLEVSPELELMPAFDEETYLWEQGYFAEHFVGTHLKQNPDQILKNDLFRSLGKELGSTAPDLVHRDFQSQNVLVKGEEIYFIDFQGMRKGHTEYDLASFICDPYMNHPAEEQAALIALWTEVSGGFNEKRFTQCAVQRLMQALGAYGNISYNQKNDWYAQFFEPASRLLLTVIQNTEYEESLSPILTTALTK